MRWGVFGDAHGNLQGLQAVVQALRAAGVDGYLNLGDTVGYGADPNACCDLVREIGAVSVLGNHDLAAIGGPGLEWFNETARTALNWTRNHLSADHLAWLANLPTSVQLDELAATHSSLPQPTEWRYIDTALEAGVTLAAAGRRLVLVGHSHVAEAYCLPAGGGEGAHVPLYRGGQITLTPETGYVLNPGSCGQPRDQWWQAAGAVLDTDAGTFTVVRQAYDLSTASDRILFAGLPIWLAVRLAEGR